MIIRIIKVLPISFVLLASLAHLAWAQDGAWDDRFDYPGGPGTDGSVMAVAEGDGVLYAAGKFNVAGIVEAKNIARWDGGEWSPLGAGLNGTVNDLLLVGDTLYACGSFSLAGDISASKIAMWDGSSWHSLGSGLTSDGNHALSANEMVMFDGELVVGGSFDFAGAERARSIARWDGSHWSSMGRSFTSSVNGGNSTVKELAVKGDALYAVGSFGLSQDPTKDRGIAKWDGQSWSTVGEGLDRDGRSIAISEEYVYAISGPSHELVRWDGTAWESITNSTNRFFRDLAVHNGLLYAAAAHNGGGTVAIWDDGVLTYMEDENGAPLFANSIAITNLESIDDGLVLLGSFEEVRGTPVNGIAGWANGEWSGFGVQKRSGLGLSKAAKSMVSNGEDLYVAGDFTTAGTARVDKIARWTGDAWVSLGGADDDVDELHLGGDKLYALGRFNRIGSTEADGIAEWDGTSWSALDIPWAGKAREIATLGDSLLIAGEFFRDGAWETAVLLRDGRAWSRLGDSLPVDVISLETHDGQLFASLKYGVQVYNGTSWIPTANGPAWTKIESVGGVLYGLNFTNLFKWDGTTWQQESDLPGDRVDAIAFHDDTVFLTSDSAVFQRSGSEWLSVGAAGDGYVYDMASHDGDLWIGGQFSRFGGIASSNIARWSRSASSTDIDQLAPGLSGLEVEIAGRHPVTHRADFLISTQAGGTLDVAVFDATGRLIRSVGEFQSRPSSQTRIQVDSGNLAPGAYFIVVSNGSNRITTPFIKAR